MIHLALKTEYSFQESYYPLEKVVDDAITRGHDAVGIADTDNTFGHILFEKICKTKGIKPIFGVRLRATKEIIKAKSARKSMDQQINLILLAKNDKGLKDLYKAVQTAYDNYYWFPRLTYEDVIQLSDDIVVVGSHVPSDSKLVTMRYDYILEDNIGVIPLVRGLESPHTARLGVPHILTPSKEDFDAYEVLSAFKGSDIRTYGGYIMSDSDYLSTGMSQEAIDNANKLADELNASIAKSDMVKFDKELDLYQECVKGAIRLGVDLDDPIYKDRLYKELEIITNRGFNDYFFIVSDMLKKARETMLVGPGRGSSGGSLVCYLLNITALDPIKYNLIFERFVSMERIGLPDIDSDLPDTGRQSVIKYLGQKYGEDNVKSIGTVNTFKPRSAISDIAKALNIPPYEVEGLKDAIIDRQGGDDRASMRIIDTFEETEIGKATLEKYPQLRVAEKIEGHAKHAGKHAAGVIISNKPLTDYCGVNTRDSTLMTTGKLAESKGLLKIDVLGLRTLSVLEETAKLAGFSHEEFYKLELNDEKVFDVFNNDRVYGVFQFEGAATRNLTRQINVTHFDDLCALTALSRPGALISGEAGRYVKRKNGQEEPTYHGELFEEITKPTYGSVVFQEQGMDLMKRYAGMSWEDVNILRNAISKSYGIEFFAKYERIFKDGAIQLDHPAEQADKVWDTIASMGSYSFNKSHAVGYSYVSYWCAWCKAYYPLEFAAANLNNAKDNDNAIKILRDFVVNDGIEYQSIDPDHSEVNWTIKDGKLLGGLVNLDGIGVKKAQGIVKTRREGGSYTPSIAKKLLNPITPFDIIFPAHHYFGDYYDNPRDYGIDKLWDIKDVEAEGDYIVVGQVKLKDLIFRNTPQLIMKRGGTVLTEDLYYLKLIIEDDTADIMVQIPPFRFEQLGGKGLSERLVEDKSWVIIKGHLRGDYRMLSIEAIEEIVPNVNK